MEAELNWRIIIPVIIAAIALVAWLVIRNKKDEEEFEKSENEVIEKNDDEEMY